MSSFQLAFRGPANTLLNDPYEEPLLRLIADKRMNIGIMGCEHLAPSAYLRHRNEFDTEFNALVTICNRMKHVDYRLTFRRFYRCIEICIVIDSVPRGFHWKLLIFRVTLLESNPREEPQVLPEKVNMAFACQCNSYLKQMRTNVIRCEPTSLKSGNQTVNGFDVVLEDTLLFPEGGGQPDDRGTIGNKLCQRVRRKGSEAVHFVVSEEPFEKGQEVEVEVDWGRRWDHMTQHSAQHLISAICEDNFQLVTTSWNLGAEVSYIELDAQQIDPQTMVKIEEVVNHKIRMSLPVKVLHVERDSEELKKVRSRFELPVDQSGPVRIIEIEGVDFNTCCGTHVSNLSHLQAIKLLYMEKGKKNKTNVFFVAGSRLLAFLGNCVDREKSLTGLLKCPPKEHAAMTDKTQKAFRLIQKNFVSVVRDLALLESERFKGLDPKPAFYSLHRKEGDADFFTIFINEVKNCSTDSLIFLSVADDCSAPDSGGKVVLAGKLEMVEAVLPSVTEHLGLKGALKGGKYQGKASNLSKLLSVEELIKKQLKIE